jgi:hypothetical protein
MTRLVTLVSLAVLAGCPAPKTDGTGPGDGKGTGGDAGSKDDELAYEPLKLSGSYFTPEGLDRPNMLLAAAPKKLTLDKQRAAYKKAKPEAKADEALVLASMLYQASQKETDDVKRLPLLEEARKALADAEPAAAAGKAKALVLHNLACLTYDLGDAAGAADALKRSVDAAPDEAGAPERRAYLAYYRVRAGQNAEAGEAVKGLTPSKDQPEIAYAIAWAAWRTGDLAAARAGILAATQGWRTKAFLPALKRDVLVFAARTGMSVEEAQALAIAFAEHIKDQPHLKNRDNAILETLVFMHQSFKFSGRIAESITLVDRIFGLGQELAKADVHKLRLEQADAAKKLGRSSEMVGYAKQASEALAACGNACTAKDNEEAAKLIFGLARFSNYLYTTAQDARWYQAAKELYTLYLAIPGITDAATVKAEAATLETAYTKAKKNAGTHDKNAIQFILDGYASQVLGCYDTQLQRDAKLGGAMTLRLEVSDKGVVTGASSEPGAGQDGIAAVAGCTVAAARGWVFPARTRPGVTRIAVAYGIFVARVDRADRVDVVRLGRRLRGLAALLEVVHGGQGDRRIVGLGAQRHRVAVAVDLRGVGGGETRMVEPHHVAELVGQRVGEVGEAARRAEGEAVVGDRELLAVELDVGVDDLAVAGRVGVVDVGHRGEAGGAAGQAHLRHVLGRRAAPDLVAEDDPVDSVVADRPAGLDRRVEDQPQVRAAGDGVVPGREDLLDDGPLVAVGKMRGARLVDGHEDAARRPGQVVARLGRAGADERDPGGRVDLGGLDDAPRGAHRRAHPDLEARRRRPGELAVAAGAPAGLDHRDVAAVVGAEDDVGDDQAALRPSAGRRDHLTGDVAGARGVVGAGRGRRREDRQTEDDSRVGTHLSEPITA